MRPSVSRKILAKAVTFWVHAAGPGTPSALDKDQVKRMPEPCF